jgi:hypothetical protein
MRIPFVSRKPEDIESLIKRATRVPSAEVPWPRLRQDVTREDTLRARDRVNARRNGARPS